MPLMSTAERMLGNGCEDMSSRTNGTLGSLRIDKQEKTEREHMELLHMKDRSLVSSVDQCKSKHTHTQWTHAFSPAVKLFNH